MEAVEASSETRSRAAAARVHTYTCISALCGPPRVQCTYTRACPTRAGARTAYSRVALGDFSRSRTGRDCNAMRLPARRARDRYSRGRDLCLTGNVFFFFCFNLIPHCYKHYSFRFYTSFSLLGYTRDIWII